LKRLCIFFVVLLSITSAGIGYAEEVPKYFEIGAAIDQGDSGEYIVTTKGEKSEEGFVHTPKRQLTSKDVMYQVKLKGSGNVILKVEETDLRGKFIKDKSIMVQLSDQWETYELPFSLTELSSQIDVFVLTAGRSQKVFYFRDLFIID